MTAREKAKLVMTYLKSDSAFEIIADINTDHMGAVLVDGILQAGANFNAVDERKKDLLANENAKTVTGFINLINLTPIETLVRWAGKKPHLIVTLLTLFASENIDTVVDLNKWLKSSGNRVKLMKIKGIKNKTVDYLVKLSGTSNVAIDRYWYRLYEIAGVTWADYSEAKEIAEIVVEEWNNGVDLSSFDTSVWKYMRKKSKRNKLCS